MNKMLIAGLATASLAMASSAFAAQVVTTNFTLDDTSFGTGSAVHWGGGNHPDVLTTLANINTTPFHVTISSTDTFDFNGNGEATIEDKDKGKTDPYTDLKLVFEDHDWGKFTFALKGSAGDTFDLKVNGVSIFTSGMSGNCSFCGFGGSGETKFTLYALNNSNLIHSVEFAFTGNSTTTGAESVKQLRVQDVTFVTPPIVPEPATWAMMIMGFGGVGAMIRRRRSYAL